MIAVVDYYEPWWMQILKAIVIFAVGLQLVPVILIAERKLLGRFQNRYGPNRVGPFGVLQPLADIIKLAMIDLDRELKEVEAQWASVKVGDVAAFNTRLKAASLPPLTIARVDLDPDSLARGGRGVPHPAPR